MRVFKAHVGGAELQPQGTWQCPAEFSVSEMLEKWQQAVCPAHLRPGAWSRLCGKKAHILVGEDYRCPLSRWPRFLLSCCFPPFLSLPGTHPSCFLPGPELPQAEGLVDFCALSFPGAAMDMGSPKEPGWCRAPPDTLPSPGRRVRWLAGVF